MIVLRLSVWRWLLTGGLAALAVGAVGGSDGTPGAAATRPAVGSGLKHYVDQSRHFHIDYPPSWGVASEPTEVMHYTTVLAASNSAGRKGMVVGPVQTRPDTWELGPELVLRQIPAGAAYVQVAELDGPGGLPQFGPGYHEMQAANVSGLLKAAGETRAGDLVTRSIEFSKWGRHWGLLVYMHAPVTDATRDQVESVLNSFGFDGVPSGDEVWALGLAHQHLPAEMDPEKFDRQGGSSLYYCSAGRQGQDVTVTFTKHLPGTPARQHRYRVTAEGRVEDLDAPTERR